MNDVNKGEQGRKINVKNIQLGKITNGQWRLKEHRSFSSNFLKDFFFKYRVKFKQNGNESSFQFKFDDYTSSVAKAFQKVIELHTSKSTIFSPLMWNCRPTSLFQPACQAGGIFFVVESKNSPVPTQKLSKVTVCGRNVHAYFFLFVPATYFLLGKTGCSGSFKTHPWFKIDICT